MITQSREICGILLLLSEQSVSISLFFFLLAWWGANMWSHNWISLSDTNFKLKLNLKKELICPLWWESFYCISHILLFNQFVELSYSFYYFLFPLVKTHIQEVYRTLIDKCSSNNPNFVTVLYCLSCFNLVLFSFASQSHEINDN